jgi:hypothetical protein
MEGVGKRGLFGQDGTVALEIILADLAPIHPQTEALVANELHHTDRFLNGRLLLLVAVQFVLGDPHSSCPPVCFLFY